MITPDRRPVLQLASGRFWANNHTHIIQGKPPVSTEFLYLRLCDLDVSGYVTGAAQPKITQENLNRISMLVAPSKILGPFNTTVQTLFAQAKCLASANLVLRGTRDLLLPRLISGEVDVSDLHVVQEEANHGW